MVLFFSDINTYFGSVLDCEGYCEFHTWWERKRPSTQMGGTRACPAIKITGRHWQCRKTPRQCRRAKLSIFSFTFTYVLHLQWTSHIRPSYLGYHNQQAQEDGDPKHQYLPRFSFDSTSGLFFKSAGWGTSWWPKSSYTIIVTSVGRKYVSLLDIGRPSGQTREH